MGLNWSSRRRQNHHHHHHHRPDHHHLLQTPPYPPPPLPPPTPAPAPALASTQDSSSSDHLVTHPPPLPPSQGPQGFAFSANCPYPIVPAPSFPPPPHVLPYSHHPNAYNLFNYAGRPAGQSSYQYHHFHYNPNHSNGWSGVRPPLTSAQQPPVPYVDHQSAKKIKNDVNVHKDTIRVELDANKPDSFLVSFTFDASVDGSFTIFYFAKEGADCTFTPTYPEIYMPEKIPFSKGLCQKFFQPSGTGIDLGFFDADDLSNHSPEKDVFPLVIFAESVSPSNNEKPDEKLENTTFNAQITQAVLEKDNEGHFQAKVIKQILWVDGVRYELYEIYGISNSEEKAANENDSGKECVICMTDPKDTVVLPCRHMCMCSGCAKTLRLQSRNCPICRQPIEGLMEIKVEEGESRPVQDTPQSLSVAAS